jgi:hypothetical protein
MCLPVKKRGEINAVTSDSDRAGGGGSFVMAGQSVHTDARDDQVHFECSGGDRCSSVVTEHFWTIPFIF